MKSAQIRLPFPPSMNRYWRHAVIHGRSCTLLSAKGREFRENVLAAVLERFGRPKPLPTWCRLHVTIDLHPPTRRSFDVDNFVKGILDGLTHAGVWEDDSQVDQLTVRRRSVASGGFSLVTISEVEQ